MNVLLEGERRDDDLRHLLRREVGEVEFDYRLLVAGAHQRARRLRRRRALTAGAVLAVLGVALVGAVDVQPVAGQSWSYHGDDGYEALDPVHGRD